jgi:Crinkler effector protein N-terminal domain
LISSAVGLEINYFVQGQDPRHNVSTVVIPNTKNVSALRQAIWKEKEHAFKGVDANTLVLWKVSIPSDSLVERDPRIIDLNENQSLLPMNRLSKVFSDVPEEDHIHILVRAPPAGEWAFCCSICQF